MIMAKRYLKFLIYLFIIFFITCAYFINIETHTIYGDDLALYVNHFKNKTAWDALNFYAPLGKFRPVSGLINTLILFIFDKNLHYYFLFNIGIQTLITCVFALILDLVLQSPLLSVVIGSLVGLSRFAFYSVTQVLNGGTSEGL